MMPVLGHRDPIVRVRCGYETTVRLCDAVGCSGRLYGFGAGPGDAKACSGAEETRLLRGELEDGGRAETGPDGAGWQSVRNRLMGMDGGQFLPRKPLEVCGR